MRKECKMVYTYDELDDSGKEKAREWYAQQVFDDPCDWEYVYEDAVRMAELIGIEIDQRAWTNPHGFKGKEPRIYFSDFNSQGDGASFEGTYRYRRGAVKAIKAECNDAELIRIAYALQAVQRKHFYRLYATCKTSGNYYHSGCMSVDVEYKDDPYRDIGDDEEEVRQLMRDFADWIYKRLSDEYDYQTSDEAVEESILANEYEFYETGELLC